MEEKKCMECGEVLSEEMKECPKCGCPVSYSKKGTLNSVKSVEQSGKKGIMAIISLIIGVIIAVLGFVVLSHKANIESYDAKIYNVDKAVFGADFYTEIYGASDTIVDELSDINGGMSLLSTSIISVINAIYNSSGMIIIAIGLCVISISLMNLGKMAN